MPKSITAPSVLSYPIILASKSPRRSQLLKEAGFNFTVRAKEVAEDYAKTLSPIEVPPFLAEKKAEACREFITRPDAVSYTHLTLPTLLPVANSPAAGTAPTTNVSHSMPAIQNDYVSTSSTLRLPHIQSHDTTTYQR